MMGIDGLLEKYINEENDVEVKEKSKDKYIITYLSNKAKRATSALKVGVVVPKELLLHMLDRYNLISPLMESKDTIGPINWKHHFENFGGFKEFMKATGLTKDEISKYVESGETPQDARQKIRKAVSKRIINDYKNKK